MAKGQTKAQAENYPTFSVAPPPRRGNFIRALLYMVGSGLIAGSVVIGFLTHPVTAALLPPEPSVQESLSSSQPQPPRTVDRTVIVKSERHIPFPESKEEAAKLFGGDASDWFRGYGGWSYAGDTPLEFSRGPNVTVYTSYATLVRE